MRVTVFIPTFNGEEYLDELLTAVEGQHFAGEVEILVIDSGSKDATVEIVRHHSDVRLIEIPNDEFGHGRTRDRAVREATGDYVALLTQDAVPANAEWLDELIAPFAIDDRVALVTGRQHPRARAFPLQKYEIIEAFQALGPDWGVSIAGAGPTPLEGPALDRAAFHSDVNAAVRRDLATGPLPFRDVPYSEDQMMGRDVLAAGWFKAYAGAAVVIHSNDLTFREYGRRIADETVGLRRIGTPIGPLSWSGAARLAVRGIAHDSIRIMADRGFSRRRKLFWLVVNPAYQILKWTSYRRASRVDLEDEARIRRASLEHGRKTA